MGVAWAAPGSGSGSGSGSTAASAPTSASAKPTSAPTTSKKKATAPRQNVRVVIAGSKPFIIHNPGRGPSGVAIDVWKAIAGRIGVDYSVRSAPRVPDAIDAVMTGKADIAVGPISITAKRAERVDFTQPYFASSTAILTTRDPPSMWRRMRPLLSRAFIAFVGGLVVVLFLVGNVIWLVERKSNPEQFPPGYLRGVGNGMWFALVTMTTVGYGDRAPVTRAGRVFASVWMLVAMIGASSLTASIATLLTISSIETQGITTMEKLRRRRVAVVAGTPGELVAQRYGARVVRTYSKKRGLDLMRRHKVDAMLYDLPVLRYFLLENPSLPLAVHASRGAPDNYGFVVRRGSSLRHRINIALLSLREARLLQLIMRRWHLGEH